MGIVGSGISVANLMKFPLNAILGEGGWRGCNVKTISFMDPGIHRKGKVWSYGRHAPLGCSSLRTQQSIGPAAFISNGFGGPLGSVGGMAYGMALPWSCLLQSCRFLITHWPGFYGLSSKNQQHDELVLFPSSSGLRTWIISISYLLCFTQMEIIGLQNFSNFYLKWFKFNYYLFNWICS